MMNSRRIAALARDADLKELLASIEAQLTKKVMARATTEEDRATALAEYHAIQSLKARFASVAHDEAEKEKQ
jgi:hypothetical protein